MMRLYSHLSDVELVDLLKSGNQLAYTEIFERYTRVLLRHAFRLLSDHEETHDVVQDVFLQLWQKREDLSFKTSLSAYLYASVRNKIFNLLSHRKVILRYAESISSFMVEGYNIIEDQIREKELASIIEKEVNALPPKMREVFLLNKKEGLNYREISERLNISSETAKQQVYKAMKILKLKIDSFLSIYPFL